MKIAKRVVSIAMVIFGLTTALTGIWNFFPPFNAMFYIPHVTSSCIFGILMVVHICLNIKPFLRYFKKLRWWWVLVGLGLVSVIWVGIIMPILLF